MAYTLTLPCKLLLLFKSYFNSLLWYNLRWISVKQTSPHRCLMIFLNHWASKNRKMDVTGRSNPAIAVTWEPNVTDLKRWCGRWASCSGKGHTWVGYASIAHIRTKSQWLELTWMACILFSFQTWSWETWFAIYALVLDFYMYLKSRYWIALEMVLVYYYHQYGWSRWHEEHMHISF